METPLQIKVHNDFISAMREKDTVKKNVLSVLRGDMQTFLKNNPGRVLDDATIMTFINKIIKGLNETIASAGDETSKRELEILQAYMPALMSEAEVEQKIDELTSSGVTKIGDVMKAFNGLNVDKRIVLSVHSRKTKPVNG
jgi:uncharacterized protein YqeY